MKLQEKIIFITGASQGIGFELAKLLSLKGNLVIIGARNTNLLAKIKSKFLNIYTIYFDALDNDNITKVKSELQNKFGKIDILINNSAVCYSYDFYKTEVSFEKIETEIATNFTSPIKVVKVFLPLLEKNTETSVETSTPITHKTKEEVKILNQEKEEKSSFWRWLLPLLVLGIVAWFLWNQLAQKEALKTKTATENVTIIPEPIPADSLSDAQKKIEFKGNSLQVVSDGLEDRMITFLKAVFKK